ncbi:glycosyltransferase [Acidimicrobium ferrooxidans]|uniref:glycosyltransferase n=1 Tax=Acidimicrobium ferrooxidans TaxID=53635 RepID=UPI001493F680|nr:glycosyltransferase [Acidimicrobium ferrooxidans]
MREFTRALVRSFDPDTEWVWLVSPNVPVPLSLRASVEEAGAARQRWTPISHEPRRGHEGMPIDASGWTRTSPGEVDVLVVASPFEGFQTSMTMAPSERPHWARRLVSVVYDLIPLRHPALYLAPHPAFYAWYRRQLDVLRASDALLCISHAVALDVTTLLGVEPERVHVVGSAPFGGVETGEVRGDRAPDDASRTLLYVYHQDYRKRPEVLVDAAAIAMREDDRLRVHLVTNEEEAPRIRRYGERAGIPSDRLRVEHGLSDQELVRAYASAWCTVIPSLDEGYGLPAVESVMCGAPVLASDVGGLPEALGTPEALFRPGDVGDLVGLLRQLTAVSGWREQLFERQRQHVQRQSWDQVGRRSADAIGAALGTPSVTESGRPTLALRLPRLEPDGRWGADRAHGLRSYLGELACVLDARFDLELQAPGWESDGIVGTLLRTELGAGHPDPVCTLHELVLAPDALHGEVPAVLTSSGRRVVELHAQDVDVARLLAEVAAAVAGPVDQDAVLRLGTRLRPLTTDLLTVVAGSDDVLVHDGALARWVAASGAVLRDQEVVSEPYPAWLYLDDGPAPRLDRLVVLVEPNPRPDRGPLVARLAAQACTDIDGVLRLVGGGRAPGAVTTLAGRRVWVRPLPDARVLRELAQRSLCVVVVDDEGPTVEFVDDADLDRRCVVVRSDQPLLVGELVDALCAAIRTPRDVGDAPHAASDASQVHERYDAVRARWSTLLATYERLAARASVGSS